jgi:hypothetical protein
VVVEGKIDDFYAVMAALGFSERETKAFRSDRKTYACLPIPDGQQNPLGVLALDAKTPEVFTADAVEVVERTFLPLYSRLLMGPAMKEGLND